MPYTQEQIDAVFSAVESNNIKELNKALDELIKLGEINWDKLMDDAKRTPIHYATINGNNNKEAIEVLIKAGADVNAEDIYGWTPFFFALKYGNKEIMRLLSEKLDVNAKAKEVALEEITPLHAAVGDEELIKLLIERKADVNAKDKNGWTPLHAAIQSKNPETIKALIKAGADVNAKDKNGWTPFHYAVGKNDLVVVELLIKAGADVNTKCKDGWTPLLIAAHNGNETTIEALTNAGADVNATLNSGTTPLDFAIKDNNKKAIEILEAEARKQKPVVKTPAPAPEEEEELPTTTQQQSRGRGDFLDQELAKQSKPITEQHKVPSASADIHNTPQQTSTSNLPPLPPKQSVKAPAPAPNLEEEELPTQPRRRISSVSRALGEMSKTVFSLARRASAADREAIELRNKHQSYELMFESLQKASLIQKQTAESLAEKISALPSEDSGAAYFEPNEVKEVVEIVKKARVLLSNHIGDLQKVVAIHVEKEGKETELSQALNTPIAQEYYLDVIRLLNGVYSASIAVDSGHVANRNKGKIGAMGDLVTIMGGFTPVQGAFSVVGELMRMLGSKLERDQLVKLVGLCSSPSDMDKIAKNVALALLKEGRGVARIDKKSGKEIKGSNAAEDVGNILKMVFSKENKTIKQNRPNPINNIDYLTGVFVQAAHGKGVVANAQAEEPVIALSGANNPFTNKYLEKISGKTTVPARTEEEIEIRVNEKLNTATFSDTLYSDVIIQGKKKSQLTLKLINIICEEVKVNPVLREYFFEKDQSSKKYMGMADDLQEILRSKDVNAITTDDKVNSLKIEDETVIKAVVAKFVGKLLERKAEKEQDNTTVPSSKSSSTNAGQLMSPQQAQQERRSSREGF